MTRREVFERHKQEVESMFRGLVQEGVVEEIAPAPIPTATVHVVYMDSGEILFISDVEEELRRRKGLPIVYGDNLLVRDISTEQLQSWFNEAVRRGHSTPEWWWDVGDE